MGKKAKHPEHENLERWLVSYADFMTLLFATFTALYALSLSDANKLKQVAEAIAAGFEEQSIIHGIQSVLTGQSPPARNPDPLSQQKGAGPGIVGKFESMTYKPGEVKSMQALSSELRRDIEKMNREIQVINQQIAAAGKGDEAGEGAKTAEKQIRPVEAAVQERGIRISLDSRLLFPPGAASVQPVAYKYLDVIAQRLKKFTSNIIHVEGHTDDQGISSAIFPSNWELSAARSSSVIRYFIARHDFNPQALVAVGYGDTQPLGNNKTPEGRAQNRRVDIILYSQKVSALVSPRQQYMKEHPLLMRTETPPPKVEIPTLPENPQDGPVKVIIKEADGTERILIPKTKPADSQESHAKDDPKILPVKSISHEPEAKSPKVPAKIEAHEPH